MWMVSSQAPWAKYFRIIKTPQIDLNFITAQPISIQYNLTCRIANVIRNIIRKTVTVDLLMLSIWSVIFLLSLSLSLGNLKLVWLPQSKHVLGLLLDSRMANNDDNNIAFNLSFSSLWWIFAPNPHPIPSLLQSPVPIQLTSIQLLTPLVRLDQ